MAGLKISAMTDATVPLSGTELVPVVQSGFNRKVTVDNFKSGLLEAPSTPAQGDVMYYNGTSWVGLAAGTNGQYLKTQGTGADPIWAAVTGDGVGIEVPANSAQGDILYHDGTGYVRLAAGTDGQFLKTSGVGANPAWSAVSGFIEIPAGAAQGDILYHNGTGFVSLAAGVDGQYLKTQGAGEDPVWADVVAAGAATINDCIVFAIALGG